jgi:hypothetical protein
MTRIFIVAACLVVLTLLISGWAGSRATPQALRAVGSQHSLPPNAFPPPPLHRVAPNTWHEPGLRCTFRFFSDGSGARSIVKSCLLSGSR